MNEHHLKERLEGALHRGHHNATEQELVAVTAIVLAIVKELTTELVVVINDLNDRLAAIEGTHSTDSTEPAPAAEDANPAIAETPGDTTTASPGS